MVDVVILNDLSRLAVEVKNLLFSRRIENKTDPKIYRAFETLPKIRSVFHEVEKSKLIETSLQMWSKDREQVSANLEKFLAGALRA